MGEYQESVASYREVLHDPVVRRLECEIGLAGKVQYHLVGQRQSFHGKAQMVNGTHRVRLSANPRPREYLLLTLLHEWAHVLVHEEMWKSAAGRSGPGARPRRFRPHGSEWRRQYARLARLAVRAALFPGNEAEVLRHAGAGEAQTARARLVAPDGRLLLPDPQPVPRRFRPGDAVCFADASGRTIAGTVTRVNRQSYTVSAMGAAVTYRVPMAHPSLQPMRASPPPVPAADRWRPGMRVAFAGPNGRELTAVVRRVNRLTLT
ncbi:MAG: hypothetical protein QHJ73_09250, partial [Armatimonadota bacterium]|nr:hypothetical protein [Armatimonadota bacterium]